MSLLTTNLDFEWDVKDIPKPKYQKGDKVLIVDGDILAYKTASAVEKRYVTVTNKLGKTKEFKTKTEFKKWCADKGKDFNNYAIENGKRVESLQFCLNTLNRALVNVMKSTGCNKYEIYVEGKTNFRRQLPLINLYKDREVIDRPDHLSDCKNHLISQKGAIRIGCRETDDYFQQRLYELYNDTVECVGYTNDKDSKQNYQMDITLYNPDDSNIKSFKKGVGDLWETSNGIKGCGLKWLIFQNMLYDKIDNYVMNQFYKKSYGEKSFYKDFKPLTTEKEVLEKAVEKWKQLLPDEIVYNDCFGAEQKHNWLSLAELYFQCCYMKISADDNTCLKSLFEEYNVQYI